MKFKYWACGAKRLYEFTAPPTPAYKFGKAIHISGRLKIEFDGNTGQFKILDGLCLRLTSTYLDVGLASPAWLPSGM